MRNVYLLFPFVGPQHQTGKLGCGEDTSGKAILLYLLFGKNTVLPSSMSFLSVEQGTHVVLEQNERFLEIYNLIPWGKKRKK